MKRVACFTLGLLLALAACRPGSSRAETVVPGPPYIRDSLDQARTAAGYMYRHGSIIRQFGEDSIWVLRRPDSVMMEKHYLDSLSPISRISFIEGKKYYVRYRSWLTPGRLQDEFFDPESGAVTSRYFDQPGDGITDASGEYYPITCYREEYYPGGRIKNTGFQGLVGPVGVALGRTSHYGEDGRLSRTEDFVHPPGATAPDYREMRFLSYIVVQDYDPAGRPKSRKLYANEVYYDTDFPDGTDEDGRWRLGTWKFYDEQGRTVRTERYSRFNELTGENIPLNNR